MNLPTKLLVFSFFLYTVFCQDIVSTYTSYYSLSKDDFECYKNIGVKKMIFRQYRSGFDFLRSQVNATNNAQLTEQSDVVLYAKGSTNAKQAIANFLSYFNSTPYSTVWFKPYDADCDCGVLRTYQYECGLKGLKCGFTFSDYEWDTFVANGTRTSCPQLAEQGGLLFYRGNIADWKQMGGWTRYNQIEVGERIDKCYSEDVSIYRVQKR